MGQLLSRACPRWLLRWFGGHQMLQDQTNQSSAHGAARACSVLFIDGVDPDNFAVAVLFARLCRQRGESAAHIVLSQRKCSFGLARFSPAAQSYKRPTAQGAASEETQQMQFKPDLIREQGYEKDHHNAGHSQALLNVFAWMLHKALSDCGLQDFVVMYDGGLPKMAGISHIIHDYEDLFINNDGTVRSLEDYTKEVEKLYNMAPEERIAYRMGQAQAKKVPPIRPLEALSAHVIAAESLNLAVGGPFTAVARLAELCGNKVNEKNGELHAMACSWTGDKNLLGDNFNNQLDIGAFESVMIQQAFPKLRRVITTTETCKAGQWITLLPSHFEALNMPTVGNLVELWKQLKFKYQPMFDVCVLLPQSVVPFSLRPISLNMVNTDKAAVGRMCRLDTVPVQATNTFAYATEPTSEDATKTAQLVADYFLSHAAI